MTKMEEHGVVPDVIDVVPADSIEISYPSGVTVNHGNILTPTQVKNVPTVKWPAKDGALYLLCMTDPDVPSRKEPTFRDWHHWLVGNISGNDVAKGDVLSAYVGSGPAKDTGLHRYVFVVYQQPGKLDFAGVPRLTNKSVDNRAGFSIKKFAEKFNLGQPIAGNFFQAEFDDYVPTLYKQLGAA
ncbi:protein D2-like [Chrysoperla carnea]|uniref:protein D2-like n=1 Tax=Chrysoperla carnea TaxID=189513 RepID=UPI001D068392|nr:protein D2-like [Chrysoperla carnea]